MYRRHFGACKSALCALLAFFAFIAHPVASSAQVLQWLKRQLGNGAQNNNNNYSNNNPNNVPFNPQGKPIPGPNGGYYYPVQNPVNPITGWSAESAESGLSLPPGIDPRNAAYPPSRSNTKKCEQYLQKGDDLLGQQKYAEAEQMYFQAYINDRTNAAAYNDLGVVLDRQNYTSAALDYYERAATIDPNDAQAYYNAGLDYYTLDGPIPSWKFFTQALRLDGSHADWWYWIGNEKVLNGEYSDGLYYYTQAIHLNGQYADAYHWRGALELRLGKDAIAHADLQRARALNPALGPQIAALVNAVEAARRLQARLEAEAEQEASSARSIYQSHERSIRAVVSEGPRYYQSVYSQAINSGESEADAEAQEQTAEDNYNKDVALQSAWENNDYSEMERISSGDADRDEISSYDSSSSPTSGNADNNYNQGSSDDGSSPQPSESESSDSGGGDD